ncbi:hypothetical protein GA0070609_4989 [Micromonospora echinaurantiaca]|uniref:4-amino-4-deoxy-L-arabinose transferase n=1 Tax=Micromonospora echinaurantiaca TaxID=47857 RepID=A0A1C5JV71_9ACTN|nr:hypothetical protein [Micromonospora echinaurantiaca]SCG74408.1 hypothetical protein GA0070609_4989 [Micromonospora echinaurantiaca]
MSSAAPTAPDAVPDQAVHSTERALGARLARLRAAAARNRTDLLVGLLFVVLAGWLTHGLWPDPTGRTLALNPEDQALYEWFLAVDARALLGDFGLLSDRLNAPDGVNLMTNTSVIALGVLLAPVTLLLGAPVTFALLAAGNLAGTAIAWYLLFTRTLRARRLAAGLGAAVCGFGPGMVSQSNSHLHMTAQWLVPMIVWLVIRMLRAADPGRAGGDGAGSTGPDRRRLTTSAIGLAAAVTAQVFIGEEVLFLCAVTLLVMAVGYAVVDRDLARRALPGFAGGMALATGLALLALAGPLWFQFAGPQGVADGMFSPDYFSADLRSWWSISPLSLAGGAEAARLTTGPAEYNTFLGWPLLTVTVGCAVWLGRRPLVVACVAGALAMGALSLGPRLVLDGDRTALPGPYALIAGLPVVDGALPMRFALAVLPLTATLLVLAVDRALRDTGRVRRVVPALVGAALLPLVPTPLPTADRPPVPEFITAGHWRQCVEPGGVLVPVPLPTPKDPWPMRWAAAADAGFGIPEGFFIGPYGRGGTAAMGTYKQPTSALLAEVAKRGLQPAIGDEQRQQAKKDADFWGASCVALAVDTPHAESLRGTLEQLYGPATRIADAWIWRV